MATLILNSIRLSGLAVAAALALAPPGFAGDVSLKLDAGTGFSIRDSSDSVERLRVDEATGNVSRNGALFVHTTGTNNLFLGVGAGNPATTESAENTAVGYRALYSNTTGFSNSAFGNQALRSNTTGSYNSALGSFALYSNTTGSRNLAFGQYAGQDQTTGSDNIYLANPGVAEESGRIRIGTDLTHTATFIAGIHGTDVGGSALPVFVDASGQLGTGGGSPAPWTADIDAAFFDLVNFGDLHATQDSLGLNGPTTNGLYFDGYDTGFGWQMFANAGGGLDTNNGWVHNRTWNQGYNIGADINPHTPYVGLAHESSFATGGSYDPLFEVHNTIARARGVHGLTSITGTFSVGEPVIVRETGGGDAVLGHALVVSWSPADVPPTLTLNWITGLDDTNDAAIGDIFETTRTTSVTGRVGNFAVDGVYQVYNHTGPCPSVPDANVIGRIIVRAVGGDPNDITFLHSQGSLAALQSGRTICANGIDHATFHAQLGSVSAPEKFGTWNSGTVSHQAFRMGPAWTVNLGSLGLSWSVATNEAQAAGTAGHPALSVGAGQVAEYVSILSNYTGWWGEPYVWIGSSTKTVHTAMYGNLGFWDGDSNFGTFDTASTNLTADRLYTMPDVAGTLGVFTSLSGCADDAAVLASGADGGVKCGGPVGPGDVVSLGGSVVGGIPTFTDATGDRVADSGATILDNLLTLPQSSSGGSSIKFFEDANGGSNSITLRGFTPTQNLSADLTLSLTRFSRALATGAGRGPVTGGVSDGLMQSTAQELCDRSYSSASGVVTACVAGTAKSYTDGFPVAVDLIGCGDEVSSGIYFETVCTVE